MSSQISMKFVIVKKKKNFSNLYQIHKYITLTLPNTLYSFLFSKIQISYTLYSNILSLPFFFNSINHNNRICFLFLLFNDSYIVLSRCLFYFLTFLLHTKYGSSIQFSLVFFFFFFFLGPLLLLFWCNDFLLFFFCSFFFISLKLMVTAFLLLSFIYSQSHNL